MPLSDCTPEDVALVLASLEGAFPPGATERVMREALYQMEHSGNLVVDVGESEILVRLPKAPNPAASTLRIARTAAD